MYRRVNELLGTNFKSDGELDWYDISSNKALSEEFIKEFKDHVKWEFISAFQVLSEDFIREFEDYVNWRYVSSYQVLGEKFIREFEDKIIWESISQNQLLSWNFILEFKDRVDWKDISLFQPFIDPKYKKIDKRSLKENTLYHLYQQTKDKKWFIGYLFEDSFPNVYTMSIEPSEYYFLKVRIYWKDLKLTSRVKKFELIRRVKYV